MSHASTIYGEVILKALTHARKAIEGLRNTTEYGRTFGKGASGDITYGFDKKAEGTIIKVLRAELPDCLIHTEESGILGEKAGQPVILVDPVDGSTNALHGVPFYCSSVLVSESSLFRDTVAVGILNLISGELTFGEKGRGAFHNNVRVKPSEVTELRKAVISVDVTVDPSDQNQVTRLKKILGCTDHPRFLGSAALETSLVAMGRIDAFVQPRVRGRLLDTLPGAFLVKEAGGFTYSADGDLDKLPLTNQMRISLILAGNKILGRKLTELLSS